VPKRCDEQHQLGMRQSTDWSLAEKYKFVDEVVVLARLTYPYVHGLAHTYCRLSA
jgi:hypothetical protein